MNLLNDYQTIIAFKEQNVMQGYISEFAEFLDNRVLVTTLEGVGELFSVHNIVESSIANSLCHASEMNTPSNKRKIAIKLVDRLADAYVYSVARPYLLNYKLMGRNWYYAKHLINSASDHIICNVANDEYTLDDELCPLNYAIEESIEHKQSSNDRISCDDLTFSYSCGYYDADNFSIVDGDLIDRDDVVTLHNGELCHTDDAVWCESLDEYYKERDCTRLEDDTFAPDHLCVLTSRGWMLRDSDDIAICDGCDEHFHIDDTYYHEGNEESYCEDCYHEQGTSLQNRKSYSSDVLEHCDFGQYQNLIKGKGVYIGFELETKCDESEVESFDDEIATMNRCFDSDYNYAIATEDGSLDSNLGCEFIFRPDSIEGHSENLDHFMETFSNYLEEDAGNGYGLHVHISSHFLTDKDKVKIQNFTSLFDEQFRSVGGRSETNYQRKKIITKNGDLKVANKERYGTVNMLPANTIEFRFPKAIVCKDHIMKNLMLGYAIVMFCKFNLSYAKINHVKTFSDFVEYCDNLGFDLLVNDLKKDSLYNIA